ncbi:hypothetical protein HYH03_010043 [Edaphochlamys debaryana]|uniref:Ankyrin repeat domain-containing protein n=1 Tax=Edaphochlamys debaryana TaxID=47281 RepID=A0A835Y609_9CHLO|nr:hypothetical protein HYH03_010043 [Edaphochlamys debaryana]|eukprot:KAG2491674.1 hypothetical protein HYH03_010043 [Edaphochlamys debaryana]
MLAALPPNAVTCLRLVDKSSAAVIPAGTIEVKQGVPGWAVVEHLTRRRHELTPTKRRQLLGAVAAFGDVAWLERAAEAADCTFTEEAVAASAGAGKLACCQRLLALGCPLGDKSLTAAASAGQGEACEWLLANGAELSPKAPCAVARRGHAELARSLWERVTAAQPAQPWEASDFLSAMAHGCDLAKLQEMWQPLSKIVFDVAHSSRLNNLRRVCAAAAGSPTTDWRMKLSWLVAMITRRERQHAAEEGTAQASLRADVTIAACKFAACEAAARCPGAEAVDRLTWLHTSCDHLRYPVRASAVMAAAAGPGNLPAVTWLHGQDAELPDEALTVRPPPGVALADVVPALEAAGCRISSNGTALDSIARGDTEGLMWLLKRYGAGGHLSTLTEFLQTVALEGRVDMLEVLRAHAAREPGAQLWPTEPCHWAALWHEAVAGGCEAVLQWVKDNGGTQQPPDANLLYMTAARNGDHSTLRALARLRVRMPEPLDPRDARELVEQASQPRGPYRPASASPLELLMELDTGLTWEGLEEILALPWGTASLLARVRELRARWQKEQAEGGAEVEGQSGAVQG